MVLTISKVLGEDGRPETVSQALGACLETTCSPAYRHAGGFKFGIGLIGDVIVLLSLGGNALVCALCDLRRLIMAGERMIEMEKIATRERVGGSRKLLRGAEKKLYFLMCWVHEQPEEAWVSLAAIVEVEKASLSNLEHSNTPAKGERKGMMPQPKVLIEEI